MIHRSSHRFARAVVILAASAATLVVAPVHAVTPTAVRGISPGSREPGATASHGGIPGARTGNQRDDAQRLRRDPGGRPAHEFGERRRILMQRPDKMRVEVERSDGERGTVGSTAAGSPPSSPQTTSTPAWRRLEALTRRSSTWFATCVRRCRWRACSRPVSRSISKNAPRPSRSSKSPASLTFPLNTLP